MLLKSSSLLQIILLLALVISLTASPMEEESTARQPHKAKTIVQEKSKKPTRRRHSDSNSAETSLKEGRKKLPIARHQPDYSTESSVEEKKKRKKPTPRHQQRGDDSTETSLEKGGKGKYQPPLNLEIVQPVENDAGMKMVDTMKTRTILALDGIECGESTLGRTACFAERRYRGDVLNTSIFREEFPQDSTLRNIYQCIKSEYFAGSSKKMVAISAYHWSEMSCPSKMFCSIRLDKPKGGDRVRVVCMGPKSDQGNNHWFDASHIKDKSLFDVDLLRLNKDAVPFMTRHVVTDADAIRKDNLKTLGYIIDDDKYKDMVKEMGQIKTENPSRMSVATQAIGGFGTRVVNSIKKKAK